MSTAVILLAGALGAAVFMIWLDRMIENDRVGLYLVLGVTAFDVFVDLPRLEPFGLAVDHLDVLLVVLIASLVARLLRGWRPSPLVGLVILVFALTSFSILRGSVLFGADAAINEARDQLYLFATILYASFLHADTVTREQVADAWLMLCKALVFVAAVRWVIVLTGLPLVGKWYSEDYWGLRTIFSGPTMTIAQGALILLPRILRGEATRSEFRWALTFLAAVVVLQHRSVYAVMLLGAAVMVWRHRSTLSRRFVMAMIGCSILAAGAFVTVLDAGELAGQASSADASSTVTFEWRVAGWQVLLAESGPQGPEDALFGEPYGAGYERVLPTGGTVDVSPHNHYLEMLLRIGIVGILLVLIVGVGTWLTLRGARPEIGDPLLSD